MSPRKSTVPTKVANSNDKLDDQIVKRSHTEAVDQKFRTQITMQNPQAKKKDIILNKVVQMATAAGREAEA